MIPRIFDRQTIAIIAGGPSLRGFDWTRLRGLPCIAINRAFETVPEASVLWWSDAKFWRSNRAGIEAHRAPWKATCQLNYIPADMVPSWVHVYQFTGRTGFDDNPKHLRDGNNSAYACIHLAVHLGARAAVLFGVDMRHAPDGSTHFHSGYNDTTTTEHVLQTKMVPLFPTLKEALDKRGVAVLNASPNSVVTCWPRVGIDEGLRYVEEARARASDP